MPVAPRPFSCRPGIDSPGIDNAITAVIEELKSMSRDVSASTEIAQVGTCAANQDAEIGKKIAEAMDKVGKDGVITVEEGQTLESFFSWRRM